MPITVKHLKVSTVPDAGDDTLVEPSDWNADHTLTGLGTMAEQNANAVAITGGTISGVTLPASNITGTLGVPNGGTGATTLTGYVKGTGTTAMTAAATIPNTDITGLGTASTKDAGAALGVATLDASGKVPVSELPAAVLGALSYQGTWDASTNSPTLTSSVGTKGYYYVVSVAGSTNLNGITDWLVGDWAVYNGTVWQKVDNTETVTSVNGQVGAVVLTTTNIAEGTNLYYTDTRARASNSAGTGISYDSGTGVITNSAPDQTVAIASGTGISVTGTYPSFTVTNTLPSLGGTVTSVSGTAGRITSTGGTTPVIDLASGVATAGTTGSSTLIPVVTIDTYGRVTGITTAANPQGTVTSVTGTSPVVSSGGATPAISLAASYGDTQNPYASKTANFVLAAPNGAAGVPTFRAIVAADIPTLNQNTTGTASNVTGTVAIGNGGTGATTAPTARTALGATTVGGNMFTLTNPSAITFPRFNADNTVSALDAATFRTAIGAGTGSGTVTSVGGTGTVNGITLTGTVTSTGNLTLGGTLSGVSLTTQVTGTLPVGNGGTGLTTLTAGYIPYGNGTSAFGSSANLFWDSTNSRLGIGSTTPRFKVDVFDDTNATFGFTECSAADGPTIRLYRAQGTLASPTPPTTGQSLGGLRCFGYTGAAYGSLSAAIDLYANQTFAVGSQGSYINFRTTADSTASPTEKMRIFGSGGVSIGNTTDAGASNLSVTGSVTAANHIGAGTGLTGTASSLTAGLVTNGVYTTNIGTYAVKRTGQTGGNLNFNSATATTNSQVIGFEGAPTNGPSGVTYSTLLVMQERSDTSSQLVVDYNTGRLYTRGIYLTVPTYSPWRTQIDDGNYNSYSPTLTGTGASGTWGININGTVGATTPSTVAATTISATGGITATSTGPFFMNATTVSANFTIPASFNATSAGPITVNTGVTVTVSTGSTWVVV